MKTLEIPTVDDKSGFGDAQNRDILTEFLLQKFRRDNTFSIVQERPDARLTVVITSITDVTSTVTSGELESERKATVSVKADYDDVVKKKQIWSKTFSQFRSYRIDEGIEGRRAAIRTALDFLSDDILLAVVSGW